MISHSPEVFMWTLFESIDDSSSRLQGMFFQENMQRMITTAYRLLLQAGDSSMFAERRVQGRLLPMNL
jgi:hypothetical protein